MEVAEHGHAPEDVMAYVDGELSSERAAAVETHLAACSACREVMQELRGLSHRLAAWEVEPPPMTLRAPSAPNESKPSLLRLLWPTRLATLPVVAASAAVVIGMLWVAGNAGDRWSEARESAVATYAGQIDGLDSPPSPPPPPAAPEVSQLVGAQVSRAQGQAGSQGQAQVGGAAAAQPEQRPTSQPQIARTATLRVIAADFDTVRSAVERIVADAGGFVGRLDLSGERGDTRSFRATVRIPSDRLEQVLTSLRQLGKVQAESQGADDVTEQVVDLNARLTNARNTERRLTLVLEQRTGKVGDVLQVEREIARVREEIERMDAERTTLERRVTYATVTLDIVEPRKAALDLGPITVADRLRNAAVEGLQQASDHALRAALLIIWMLPSLLFWGAIVAWPAVVVVRRVRASRRHSMA